MKTPLRRKAPGLKHRAFFQAIADAEEGTSAGREATAGLLVMRLIDHWLLVGPEIVGPESLSIRSSREAIMAIDAQGPQRSLLLGIVNAMQTSRDVDVHPVLPRVFAYGGALESRGAMAMAADAYEAVIELGASEDEHELVADSLLRLGYCHRFSSQFDEAISAYDSAIAVAKRHRLKQKELRARIGLGSVAMMRGNLPKAETILASVVGEAQKAGFVEERARGLHDQAVVAQRSGDLRRAVCLAYESLELTEQPNQRDRILADVGAFLVVLGRYGAARDALLLVDATCTNTEVRWGAQINLVALAARSADRRLFDDYSSRLDGVELPPEMRVNLLIEQARGSAVFSDSTRSAELLREARNTASEHHLHRSSFEIDHLAIVLDEQKRADRTPTTDPVDFIATALRQMAASAGI